MDSKKNQKTLKIKEFDDLVQSHKLKEVSPPDSARRDAITNGGKTAMTVKEATSTWFKAAKEQKPSAGFLLDSEVLDPAKAIGREMLYKGKKGNKE